MVLGGKPSEEIFRAAQVASLINRIWILLKSASNEKNVLGSSGLFAEQYPQPSVLLYSYSFEYNPHYCCAKAFNPPIGTLVWGKELLGKIV